MDVGSQRERRKMTSLKGLVVMVRDGPGGRR
jgi:hypothetical protein